MALINCPECGHIVSTKAETCPNCGIRIAGTAYADNEQSNQNVQPSQPVSPQAPKPAETAAQHFAQPAQPAQQPKQQQVYSTAKQEQEEDDIPATPKKKGGIVKYVVMSVTLLLIVIAGGVCYHLYNSNLAQKENEAYEFAMSSTDEMVLNAYLNKYPTAPPEHLDSVKARLAGITEVYGDWAKACESGQRTALQNFLNNHPGSPFEGQAKDKIDSLDFENAKKSGNVEAYNRYLSLHPNGRYSADAHDFLDNKKLEEEETEKEMGDEEGMELEEKDMTEPVKTESQQISAEETTKAKTNCRSYLMAINTKQEGALRNTTNNSASANSAVSYMNSLYKDDPDKLNFQGMENFKAEKVKTDNGFTTKVQFGTQLKVTPKNGSKDVVTNYNVTAELDNNGKIKNIHFTRK